MGEQVRPWGERAQSECPEHVYCSGCCAGLPGKQRVSEAGSTAHCRAIWAGAVETLTATSSVCLAQQKRSREWLVQLAVGVWCSQERYRCSNTSISTRYSQRHYRSATAFVTIMKIELVAVENAAQCTLRQQMHMSLHSPFTNRLRAGRARCCRQRVITSTDTTSELHQVLGCDGAVSPGIPLSIK